MPMKVKKFVWPKVKLVPKKKEKHFKIGHIKASKTHKIKSKLSKL